MWPLIKKKLNILNAAGLDQDFSINDIDAQKNEDQLDLSDFLNISLSSTGQSQEEQNNSVSKNDKAQKDSNAAASTSVDKELLEIDQEYFDFGDWDDVI